MVNIKGQPQNHGCWFSIFVSFLRYLELKLFCKWWSIVLVEQVQYERALSSTQYSLPPKNCWQPLLFPITLTRACCVKRKLHRFDAARPNRRPFNDPQVTYRGPILEVANSPPDAWHIPLTEWGLGPPQYYSEADDCWRVSSPPRTKDAPGLSLQQYPNWFVDMRQLA